MNHECKHCGEDHIGEIRELELTIARLGGGQAKRDFEWIAALERFLGADGQIGFSGNPASFVEAITYPLIERANREAALAVKLRNLCEELKPGSSSHL